MFTIVDLTRKLTRGSLSYPGDQIGVVASAVDGGDPEARVTQLSRLDMHLGTHMDAPLHFIPGGSDIAALGLTAWPGVVIRTREHIVLESALPRTSLEGCAVLFDTGWTASLESPAYYEGFPYLSTELAEALVSRGATMVGVDTPSVDAVDSAPCYPAHRALLGAGILIVEGLCNLDRLPGRAGAFWFAAFSLKIEGADGSPVRAVALLPAQTEAGQRR